MLSQPSRRIAAALVGVVCAFSTADNALAQCQYEVTAIINGPLCWGSALPLTGTGMNRLGHVTGSHWDCNQSSHDHGFFWTPRTGRVTMHKPPGVWRVNPTDINDAGLIVGTMQITGIGGQGFVYDMHTQQYLAILPPLHDGHPPLNIVSTINAINNAGIAVGARVISKPGVVPAVSNAVIWNTNTGEVIDLGVLDGPNSAAVAIDCTGTVAGWAGGSSTTGIGFIGTDRSDVVSFGPVPGGSNSYVRGMSGLSNIVVGSAWIPAPGTTGHAYAWADGQFKLLPSIENYLHASAGDASCGGQILGTATNTSGGTRAVIWTHELPADLNSLIDNSGVTVTSGVVILDDGRILARGGTSAVILNPIERPPTDLTGDCLTTVHDLLILLGEWGRPQSPADFNGDGTVDVSDLLILLANWDNPGRR